MKKMRSDSAQAAQEDAQASQDAGQHDLRGEKCEVAILLMVLVTFACVPEVASAQTLYIEGGNVHFKADSSKSAVQLTTSGKDEQATLSPDGQMAAFVRRTPEKTIKAGVGPTEATELWSIRVDGTEAKLIVAGRSAAKMDLFRQPFAIRSFLETASASTFLVPHGSHRPRCMS